MPVVLSRSWFQRYLFHHRCVQDWVTFHQRYSYEDFILGLRPRIVGPAGFELKPRVGKLLDLAIKVRDTGESAQSAVLFIDEVNRGNASRIFGEFITFMDFDYRDIDNDGVDNGNRLPVTFPSVDMS
jgi:5-methylcytosine-specific restriction endonuclease McrBC GTP-binding regulatory subunit McrB